MTIRASVVTALMMTSLPSAPAQVSVWTVSPDSVMPTSAVLRGYIQPDSSRVAVAFRLGIQWPNQQYIPVGTFNGSSVFEVTIRVEDLAPNTLYAFVVIAIPEASGEPTSHGGIVLFRTLPDSTHGSFLNHLTFRGAGGSVFSREISFGIDTRASYCADQWLGELDLPPEPPQGAADFRYVDPRGFNPACMGLGISVDMRPFFSSAQIDTYKVRFTPGVLVGYPVKISWAGIQDRYAGEVRLTDAVTGSLINVDMKSTNSVMVPGPITDLLIVAQGPVDPTLVTSADSPSPEPQHLQLAQNYPNPFNPKTTISYSLHSAGHVVLRVFDVLGRNIATLVDETQSAGPKSVSWLATEIPSGVYFYNISMAGTSQTRKLVLTR